MYSLNPGSDLQRARREFTGYEISELHDSEGRPEYTAVRKDHVRPGLLSPLVTAATIAELEQLLRDDDARRLSARLREAIYELRDKGLLPDWRPPNGIA